MYKNVHRPDPAVWSAQGGREGRVRPGGGTPRPRVILPMLRWSLQLNLSSENELMDGLDAPPAAKSHCGGKGRLAERPKDSQVLRQHSRLSARSPSCGGVGGTTAAKIGSPRAWGYLPRAVRGPQGHQGHSKLAELILCTFLYTISLKKTH